MPIELFFVIIAIPVFVIATLAYYLGTKGVEDIRKAKIRDRKILENRLISNGMWKLVGADTLTLDKAIRILEDNKTREEMTDEERVKLALLREYRSVIAEPKRMVKKSPRWGEPSRHEKKWEDRFIVGLDEPLNYDPKGWAKGLPASIDD